MISLEATVIRFSREYFRPGIPVFIIGTLLAVMFLASLALDLPDANELKSMFSSAWEKWGLWATGVAYFFECLFVLSFYWPGSFVVFVTVTLVDWNLLSFVQIWIVLNATAAVAFLVNIVIGRYGFYRVLLRFWSLDTFGKYSNFVHRRGWVAILLTGVHVNWLSVSVVAASAAKSIPPGRLFLLALVSHMVWTVPLLWLFSWASGASIGSPTVQTIIVLLFFVGGLAVCEFVRARIIGI